MASKIAFCFGVIFCVALAYVIMTAYFNPVITDAANYAANMTDPTAYPEAHWVAAAAPFWLYFVPAVAGIVAIVVRLKMPEQV